MPADVLVLLLRLGVVAVLYFFLIVVFLLTRRELRQQTARGAGAAGRLVVLDSGATGLAAGQVLPLQPVTIVGRAPTCTLVLNDNFVSATHAALTWHDGRWWLRDTGSTNGTLVDEQPVGTGEVPLDYGGIIRIGQVRLQLAH